MLFLVTDDSQLNTHNSICAILTLPMTTKSTIRKAATIHVAMQTKLLKLAAQANKKAYAPYSKFHVGAAILLSDGCIFTGCNVENASYGLTICAERNAIFQA